MSEYGTRMPSPEQSREWDRIVTDQYERYKKSFQQQADSSQSENPKDLIGQTKPTLWVIPPAALLHMGRAMGNGAKRYGAYNWREHAVIASIYLDAAQRHILSWLDGEEVAEDSGVHHLGHAMACLAILLDAQETGNLKDNRPKPGAFPQLVARFTAIKELP